MIEARITCDVCGVRAEIAEDETRGFLFPRRWHRRRIVKDGAMIIEDYQICPNRECMKIFERQAKEGNGK